VCRGYWLDAANVEAELRAQMAALGLPGNRLPTARELRAAGANSLDDAVRKHGGYPAVARRLRWAPLPSSVSITRH
jgi:hypothetical protein